MRTWTWTLTVVFLGLLSSAAYGQRPILQPEVLAGPWELTDATGIHGIFLSLGTHARGTADQPVITSQSVSVRVYHRQNGHETWGWYSLPSSGPADAPSLFDGHWEGLPEPTGLDRRTRFHFAQSSDQAFTVWMDRFMLLVDQRHGELLRLESVDHDTITLETTNVAGMRDRYQGTLSADGSTLLGTWGGISGRTLNASSRFHRVP
jgi:hypothetical protein